MSVIPCMPLRKITDGPIFGSEPGTLTALNNMRLKRGGYAEARGGFDKMKFDIGTATAAISAGGFSAVRQLNTSYGWVRDFDGAAAVGSQFSANRQLHEGAWTCFGGGGAAVNNALYFGADQPFSRIMLSICKALNSATFTAAYEYWDGGTWAALTTAETIGFTQLRTPTFASWKIPTSNPWAPSTQGDAGTGNVEKYWMRIRVATLTGLVTSPLAGYAQGFWGGQREIYELSQDPLGAANNGTLKRQGQLSATQEWFSLSSTLFSATASPSRTAEYRGRLIFVNGKESKRFDGANLVDLGIEPFIYVVAGHNLLNVAGGVLGAGIWRYYAAYGCGPCQNTAAYSDRQDALALYGPGQAAYMAEITTVAAERVRFEIAGVGIPTGVSSLYLYRTDDLTQVDVIDRPNAPAFLIQSFRVEATNRFEQNLGAVGSYYYDDSKSYVIGATALTEAANFDISPPPRCKYLFIYQNRLMIGDDETWFWSEPFTPDRYNGKARNYMRLARAQGGRHMGGIEFGDQGVLHTEDQTWGLTNIDLDIPQLFPINPGVGSCAPDATAVGDGWLVQQWRDGFYAWDGRTEMFKISSSMDQTFGQMSYETHGGSRAIIVDGVYKVRFSDPTYTIIGTAWECDLRTIRPDAVYGFTANWNQITPTGFASTLFPLAVVHAPLGNTVPGTVHGLWGKCAQTASETDYFLYLDDLLTRDNGTNYTCSATMHFPLPASNALLPNKVLAYYQSDAGWGTPTLAYATSNPLKSSPGTLNSDTPDTGDDYSIVDATFSGVAATSDIRVTFSVSSAASGTAKRQRFFGALLGGQPSKVRRGIP